MFPVKHISELKTVRLPEYNDGTIYQPLTYALTQQPFEADTVPYERYKRIHTEQPIKHTGKVVVNMPKVFNDHRLRLSNHSVCICEETGITYAVELPSPIETQFTLVHPLAFFHNVNELIKKYQRHGMPLAQLEAQVLAGMLITVLKHKGWTICKDGLAANKRLREVNKKTLTYALWYFYRSPVRYNLPQINLLDTGNPTQQLIQFLQICRGEDDSIEIHYLQEKKNQKIKARVYQTQSEKEAAQIRDDTRSARRLIEALTKDRTDISKSMLQAIDQRIARLGVLGDKAKTDLIDDIYGIFGENEHTKSLYRIIKTVSSDSIQEDLLGFALEIESDIRDWQADKASLLAALKGIKNG